MLSSHPARTWPIALLIGVACGSVLTATRAEPGPSADPVRVNSCSLSGATPMPSGLEVYNAPRGGRVIAQFTGASTTVEAAYFPLGSGEGRVSVKTGTGAASFQIRGFVDVAKLPLFTTEKIPVPGGVLSIGAAQKVRFGGATAGDLIVELAPSGVLEEKVVASAACSSLSLTPAPQPPWSPGGNDRACKVKRNRLPLYFGPDAKVGPAATVKLARGLVLWRDREPTDGFVHLQYQGTIVIDAWASAYDVKCLPDGERYDEVADEILLPSPPRLALADTPRVQEARQSVAIRTEPNRNAPVIGTVAKGCEVYVVDIVAGWASVLPKTLGIATNGRDQFWVNAKETGIKPPPVK